MKIGKINIQYTPTEHMLYWFLPILLASTFFASYAMGPQAYDIWVLHPMGFTEGYIGGLLLVTVFTGIYICSRPAIWQNKSIRWWLLLYVVAVLFFLGEDQNWGQYYRERYFGYEVPEYFLENNKERETNLHNMNSWFNEKPRILVTIWVFIAGLAVPLGWKWPVEKTKKFVPAIFWPDSRILPLAILAMVARWPERLKYLIPGFDAKAIRYSEVQESFFAFFMLMFIVQVYQRALAQGKTQGKKKK